MSLSDPQNFYRLAGKVIPWILGLALVLFVVGFYPSLSGEEVLLYLKPGSIIKKYLFTRK